MHHRLLVGMIAVAPLACSSDPAGSKALGPDPRAPSRIECSLPASEIFDGGVGRNGIPALEDPILVGVGDPEAAYLLDTDRVIGLRIRDSWVAVPHNILWWHEIVNFSPPGGGRLAVTYCPLTGSSVVFDLHLSKVGKFIVSGLLFNNNLMMLDLGSESLWPQMALGARCGPRDGDALKTIPSIEMTWAGWRDLHPDTEVVSSVTGFSRDYTLYPYDLYEQLETPLFPIPKQDRRRFGKERLLGIPEDDGGGWAFPFLELAEAGTAAAVHAEARGGPVVVFWDGDVQGAAAFRPEIRGAPLTFTASEGQITDVETGSRWRIDGEAVAGPLAGERLEPVSEAYVAFWFAWHTFQTRTQLWEN